MTRFGQDFWQSKSTLNAAMKLLHQLVTDTTIVKTGIGNGAGGQSRGGQKRFMKEAGLQSDIKPASKRQASGA